MLAKRGAPRHCPCVITYDFSGLQKALKQKVALSNLKKTPLQDIANDAVMKILVGSGTEKSGLVHLTRKATEERIKADMTEGVVGYAGKGARRRVVVRPRIHWLALSWMKGRGLPFSKEQLKETMKAILKMRIKSRAYIAAGWLWSARDLWTKSPGMQKKHKFTRLEQRNIPMVDAASKGTAAQSFAVPAVVGSGGRFTCTVTNTSRGGDTVGMENVQGAINGAMRDIQVYLNTKVKNAILREIIGAKAGA